MNAAPDKAGSKRNLSLEAAGVTAIFAALGALLTWVGPCLQQLASSVLPFAGVAVLRTVVLGGWGQLLLAGWAWTQGPSLSLLIHFSSDLVLYGLLPMLTR